MFELDVWLRPKQFHFSNLDKYIIMIDIKEDYSYPILKMQVLLCNHSK
jgi:hypothetical protein